MFRLHRSSLTLATAILVAVAPVGRAHAQSSDWGWSDGFEGYNAGTFNPGSSNPWMHGLGNNGYFIDTTQAVSAKQSMRLYGIRNGCWATLLQRKLDAVSTVMPSDFFVEFSFRNGDVKNGGCHPARATGSLRTSAGWWSNTSYTMFVTDQAGNLYLAESSTASARLAPLSWTHLRFRITRLPDGSVRFRCYLNHRLVLERILPQRATTNAGNVLSIECQEGYAWYDDVRAYPAIEASVKVVPQQIMRNSDNGVILAAMSLPLETAQAIDLNRPSLLYPGAIPAVRTWTVVAHDKAILFGVFGRSEILAAHPLDGMIKLTFAAERVRGSPVFGSDTITIF